MFPKGTPLDRVKAALDYAFACNVVGTLSEDGTLVIDPNNFGPHFLWYGFFESLNNGSVWISSQHEGEFNNMFRFLYEKEPQEGYLEVRYAVPSLKMEWNPITQMYVCV
jgi:hypothetical protein